MKGQDLFCENHSDRQRPWRAGPSASRGAPRPACSQRQIHSTRSCALGSCWVASEFQKNLFKVTKTTGLCPRLIEVDMRRQASLVNGLFICLSFGKKARNAFLRSAYSLRIRRKRGSRWYAELRDQAI